MKSFIRGILTTWIVMLLIILGLVSSIKGILIDTVDSVIKEELKTKVVSVIEEYSEDAIPEDAIKAIEKEIYENQELKNLMDKYLDKFVKAISDDEGSLNIDVAQELESLIDKHEETLKEHGIDITDEQKEELLSLVSSSGVNEFINDAFDELKDSMGDELKTIVDGYNFITGDTIKLIIVGLIVVALLFIALLKKSYYGWLSNLGSSTLTVGILFGLLLPYAVDYVTKSLPEGANIPISFDALYTYGQILLVIGGLSLVVHIVLTVIKKRRAKEIIVDKSKIDEEKEFEDSKDEEKES